MNAVLKPLSGKSLKISTLTYIIHILLYMYKYNFRIPTNILIYPFQKFKFLSLIVKITSPYDP